MVFPKSAFFYEAFRERGIQVTDRVRGGVDLGVVIPLKNGIQVKGMGMAAGFHRHDGTQLAASGLSLIHLSDLARKFRTNVPAV